MFDDRAPKGKVNKAWKNITLYLFTKYSDGDIFLRDVLVQN